MKTSRLVVGLCAAGLAAAFTLSALADENADREAKRQKQEEKIAKHMGGKPKVSAKPTLSPEERRKRMDAKLKARGVDTTKRITRENANEDPKDRQQRQKDKIKASRDKRAQAAKDAANAGPSVQPTPDKDKLPREIIRKHPKDGVDEEKIEKLSQDDGTRPKPKFTPEVEKKLPRKE